MYVFYGLYIFSCKYYLYISRLQIENLKNKYRTEKGDKVTAYKNFRIVVVNAADKMTRSFILINNFESIDVNRTRQSNRQLKLN